MTHTIQDKEILRISFTRAEVEEILLQPLIDDGTISAMPEEIHLHPQPNHEYMLLVTIDLME
jgi:hypothetical protein